ncbi:hypothetical protein MUO83_02380 [Candidatus Bathyarchaeota archaeon]|nr:hypothetical protein [Candidatus Bathyarchaeota archaeon]
MVKSERLLRIIAVLSDLFGLINLAIFLIPAIISIGVSIGSYLTDLMSLALLAEYIAVIFLSLFMIATIIRQRKIILGLRESHEAMAKQIKQLFGISCPSCGEWIEIDFPNYATSGIHATGGQPPTGSFWRNTEEREVQCKKCKGKFHVDIPRSQTYKVRK